MEGSRYNYESSFEFFSFILFFEYLAGCFVSYKSYKLCILSIDGDYFGSLSASVFWAGITYSLTHFHYHRIKKYLPTTSPRQNCKNNLFFLSFFRFLLFLSFLLFLFPISYLPLHIYPSTTTSHYTSPIPPLSPLTPPKYHNTTQPTNTSPGTKHAYFLPLRP